MNIHRNWRSGRLNFGSLGVIIAKHAETHRKARLEVSVRVQQPQAGIRFSTPDVIVQKATKIAANKHWSAAHEKLIADLKKRTKKKAAKTAFDETDAGGDHLPAPLF